MAKNITEGSTPSADKDELSETTSAANKTVVCNEKGKQEPLLDTDKISKEAENTTSEREKDVQSADVHDSKQKLQETCTSDCNGDPQKKTDFEEEEEEKEEASKMIKPETKKNSSEEFSSAKPKSISDEDGEYLNNTAAFPEVDERLDEILKVVHEDLRMQMIQRPVSESATDDENDRKEQKTVTNEESVGRDDAEDDRNQSATEENAEGKETSAESSKKAKESSEVGIVGPPTAVSELINEEELGGDSALSADQEDHVVEWIENSVKVIAEDDNDDVKTKRKRQIYEKNSGEEKPKSRKFTDVPVISSRKSQKVVSNIIKKSIKWLNKMHAMEGAVENRRNVNTAEDDKSANDTLPSSPKIPQNQQNGAALPEETAAAPATVASHAHPKKETIAKKAEKTKSSRSDAETPDTKNRQLLASTSQEKIKSVVAQQRPTSAEPVEAIKKRKSTNGQLSVVGNPRKKLCVDKREEYILEVVGDDNDTIDELVARANELKAEIFALKKLAKTKETEWNDILSKRKLKEEAYLRLQRKIQITMYMENDGQLEELPPTSSSFDSMDWENSGGATTVSKEKSQIVKKEKTTKNVLQRTTPPKTNGESTRKQTEMSSSEIRQIGEGRQGAIVDVKSIIADHRLKHPDSQVPRRGRRMRNSVNINLGTGGAMVETVMHNTDSRPSSAESCKSNPPDTVNYAKDMLMQFAKMSQQGEPVRVPQNYPNVTLHPVASLSAPQNTAPQPTGSLLHGILTKKTQSPKPATSLSPTLARLLQNSPANAATAVASTSQQSATTQHLFQNYQNNLDMSQFNNILSSSKARTEITITPVVNTPAQSHSNDLIQMEDVEEETDDRGGSSISAKQVVKDNPPSPSTPPKCQGCLVRPAQFVCAGCANQWYCSRTCQLGAWQTHSDYCPPESENGKTKTGV
ncbi:uncharacterized protein LOC109859306 isoform X1 [Pseudomyrmex gracilis]|uniref:uncharacterized protein LOC109859306 isoform X1 n=1 Tax=Pseudomyrmex gracilis TaxID=219809 RepID=UPI00099576AA|nr:uncharacterized protein LOC109859306 isoform X1 [Pseudomyrmex gracilis]XP_020293010.1 uncharacterized protein LOC109859306 isoform X1 [Pseudomyrmex gracilis]